MNFGFKMSLLHYLKIDSITLMVIKLDIFLDI